MNDQGNWWSQNDEWMIPLIGGIGWGAQNYASSQLHSTGTQTNTNFNPFGQNSSLSNLQLPEVRTRVNFPVWIPIVAVVGLIFYFTKK
jgi:hypothetical protein